VHERGEDGEARTLLEGCFDKTGDKWKFSATMAFGPAKPAELCVGDRCPGPPSAQRTKVSLTALAKATRGPEPETGASAWTMGDPPCRFPSIAVDKMGVCWTAWEQAGDILLAAVSPDETPRFIPIEIDSADSYNPVLAIDEDNIWVFFLCDTDGFYRLCGTYYDGHNVSRSMLVSELGPFNVETPAAIADQDGAITVCWSEWKANQRFMKYRIINQGILGEVTSAPLTPAGEGNPYSNAWYPSLCVDENNSVWAAWNQHYPHTISVHAARLDGEATTVEKAGGYPSICVGAEGTPYVTWRSGRFAEPGRFVQTVYCAWFDDTAGQWNLPQALSRPEQTILNDTPKITRGSDSTLWVCWSGRKDYDSPWDIYLCSLVNGTWTPPEMVSFR